MLFSNALLGASFLVAVVAQNIKFTQSPGLLGVTAGQPTNITWSGGDGSSPVTITLKQGDPKNLQTISVITGNAVGNFFTWTPSKSLPNANDYALMISQGLQDINYSGEFPLTGGATSSSASSSTTSLASASVSASSVSAALSSLNSTLSSILSGSGSAVLVTTTVGGTGASSVGTGIPISRNTTFVSQTLTATETATTTGGLQGGPPTTTVAATTVSTGAAGSSPSASATSGAAGAGMGSPLAFVLSVIAAVVYLN